MARRAEFKNRKTITITLEEEDLQKLDKIRWRERKERTDITRQAILDYIKIHGEGNDTYPLDKWNENPEFKATPAYFTHDLKWRRYYEECDLKGRAEFRIQYNKMGRQVNNVEFNEKSKIRVKGLEGSIL